MKRYIGFGIAMFAGAAIGAIAVSGLHAQAKLKAYSITEQEVIDASNACRGLIPMQCRQQSRLPAVMS